MVFQKGNPLVALREQGARDAEGERHAEADPGDLAVQGRRRPRPEVASAAEARRGPPRRRHRRSSARSWSSPRSASRSSTRPAGRRSRRPFFDWDEFKATVPGDPPRVLLNVKIFCIAEVLILPARAAARDRAQPPGAGVLPAPRARDRLHRLLPRRADDPRDHHARLRRAGARHRGRSDLDDVLGDRRARARLHGVRLGGLPRRDRVGAPEPGARRRARSGSRTCQALLAT